MRRKELPNGTFCGSLEYLGGEIEEEMILNQGNMDDPRRSMR